jgi:hypothetical protein
MRSALQLAICEVCIPFARDLAFFNLSSAHSIVATFFT